MSINPNNFIQHVTFEGVDFSTASSPFRSSDDDTKSDTPFGLNTHSSLSSGYSNKFTTHFDLDHGTIIKSFKPKPFKIIRATKEERQEQIKLSKDSKKIQKRVKAKERMQVKQEITLLLLKAPKKYIPNGIEDPNLDDRGRRRLMQRLKNRMASQQTRDQRKKHISELEEVKMHLEKANKELNEKNRLLNERNSELEELFRAVQNEKFLLIQENNELKQRGIACFDPKPMSDSRIDDPQKYFDFSEDKHDGNAPSPTLTRRNKSQGHYFNFFLGVLTICVARSGVVIQLGQETVESKINIQELKENIGSTSVASYYRDEYESVSRNVQKKRSKKNFNEDVNYYYSAAEPQESALVPYNMSQTVSHNLYSYSQLSKTPENYMVPTVKQNYFHEVYEVDYKNLLTPLQQNYQQSNSYHHEVFDSSQKVDDGLSSFSQLSKTPDMNPTVKQNDLREVYEANEENLFASLQQNYQQNNYGSEVYKFSVKNSTISHKKQQDYQDYQHINSINEIYQSLQDEYHKEEETHHAQHACKIARAGRVSRADLRKSRLYMFFSVFISILLICFALYRWSPLKRYCTEFWKKIAKEKSENKNSETVGIKDL